MDSSTLPLTPSHIRTHLLYLHQFHQIHTNVNTNTDAYTLQSIQRYSSFLTVYASHQREQLTLPTISRSRLLPPLDIALVWHTHLLNPHHYYHYCISTYGTILLYELHEEGGRKEKDVNYSRNICESNGIQYDRDINEIVQSPTSISLSTYLLPAIHRQRSFTEKMFLRFFTDSQLVYAIMNYTRFIQLISSSTNPSTIVPTLEIDLVWHTHQLLPASYIVYTSSICGYVVNHDDQIEEDDLSVGWENTQKQWKDIYGEEYVVKRQAVEMPTQTQINAGCGSKCGARLSGKCGAACGGRPLINSSACGSCGAGKCKSAPAACGSGCGAGKCKSGPALDLSAVPHCAACGAGKCKATSVPVVMEAGHCGSKCGFAMSSCSGCGAGKCKHEPQPADCAPTCQPRPNTDAEANESVDRRTSTQQWLQHVVAATGLVATTC